MSSINVVAIISTWIIIVNIWDYPDKGVQFLKWLMIVAVLLGARHARTGEYLIDLI